LAISTRRGTIGACSTTAAYGAIATITACAIGACSAAIAAR
jgi:hypothetical protein